MVKFCLSCRNTFWGGQHCPKCAGQIELLDLARPENQHYITELTVDVRPKYFARSAMMLTLFGFIMALPVGMFVFLRGMTVSENLYLWGGLGAGTVGAIAWGSWLAANRIFSKQMQDVNQEKDFQTD